MFAIGIRKIVRLVVLAGLLASGGLFAQEINWRKDLDLAKQDAIASGKLIMLHFGADWCRPCRQVESYVFSSPKVINAMNDHVVPVKIDVDRHPDLVKKFKVKGIPEDIFITPDEQIVQRASSPTDAENFHKRLVSTQQLGSSIFKDKQRLADLDTLNKQIDANAASKENLAEAWRNPSELTAVASPVSQLENANSAFAKSQKVASQSAVEFEAMVRQKYGLDGAGDSLKPADKPVVSQDQTLQPIDEDSFVQASVTAHAKPKNNAIVNSFATASPPADFSTRVAEPATSSVAIESPVAYALGGDCPVSLLTENRWVEGDKRFGCVHRGRVYLFESEVKQQRFLSSPDDFSPMLAGYDPVEFRERGKLVDGAREFGIVMSQNDRQAIVLFATRENAQKFKANPSDFLNEIRVAVERADESRNSTIFR